MNEDLKYTFNNINEWLKFAEAKNAGLLALNTASIIGILQAGNVFSADSKIFERIMIILFCISTCLCFYSVLPILNKWFRFYKKLDDNEFYKTRDSLNALYFGDISKLSSNQFIELFEFKHNLKTSDAEKDFGIQITNNAEISWQKYKVFSVAAWFSFSSFVTGLVLVIINAVT